MNKPISEEAKNDSPTDRPEGTKEDSRLPVLPLRGMVLFPGITLPIAVGRASTLRAVEAALRTDRRMFAVTQQDVEEDVRLDRLYSVGVIAQLRQVSRNLGGVQFLLQGMERAAVVRFHGEDEYFKADISPLRELPPRDPQNIVFNAMYKELRERAIELGKLKGIPEDSIHEFLDSVSDPNRFVDIVAGYVEIPVPDQQRLLEMLDVEDRMRSVLVWVQRQISTLKAQAEIKSQVQEELGNRHHEFILREQLKAIQKELGEDDPSQATQELRQKLDQLSLPSEARSEVERELSRLERTSGESMEAQVIRTYLEWIAELPWNARSADNLDLPHATAVLEADHYGLGEVKDRILEFLATRQLKAEQTKAREAESEKKTEQDPKTGKPSVLLEKSPKGAILLFVGPPGVGKSSIAKSIARALGRQYVRISLGGVRDEADVRGHRRTYVGAMPGRIIQGMKQAGTKNPVFLLDEVDKISASFQGNPASALLEVLDPVQNDSFTDHYLNVPFDLSEVLFVATANFLQDIPAPLLDRMEKVEFTGYTELEKRAIARTYLVPRQLEEAGLSSAQIEIPDGSLETIISQYTRESGVRQLERQIGAVARKVARKVAAHQEVSGVIAPEQLREYLGRPKLHPEQASRENEIGVATGMYYTPMGGDIMFVEASIRNLRGKPTRPASDTTAEFGEVSLILTGHLGEVMKESARAALTYIISQAAEFQLPTNRMGPMEVHVHVPAGAIPKDGPSAGVAMATAILSALSGRKVRKDVAMTGEITIRGRVLPIGGLKEKVLGAHRSGIKQIILPMESLDQLDEIPDEVRRDLVFTPIQHLQQVFEKALLPVESRPVDQVGPSERRASPQRLPNRGGVAALDPQRILGSALEVGISSINGLISE